MKNLLFVVAAIATVAGVSAESSSPATQPTSKTTTATTAGTAACPSTFGLSKGCANAAAAVATTTPPRGGGSDDAVHEPSTLAEVEAILLKAGAENKLVVMDFSAEWCGPCKQIAPFFSSLSIETPDVVFVKIDVDDNAETAAKYSVSAMPTFVFIKNGEVVERLMGANLDRLQELISENK